MAIRYPSIPNPTADLEALRNTAVALKEVSETLTQQRGLPANSAVTWQDLVNLGLITSSQIPIRLGSS